MAKYDIAITVYDEQDLPVKKCTAKYSALRFGTVRAFMALFNLDEIEDTAQMLKTIYGAWDKLTDLLSRVFPDMGPDDWDNVHVDELVEVMTGIITHTLETALKLKDPK